MFKALYKYWFRKEGWSVEGSLEPIPDKFIVIVGPHTASVDFLVGLMAKAILNLDTIKFLGKSQLFRFPFGFIFRALGGFPVERSEDNNLVDTVTEIFNSHDKFCIALAPEGTRSKVGRLKTGFYHIAKNARVPIYPIGFDFRTKTIIVKDAFIPGTSMANDFKMLLEFYTKIEGKNPELGIDMTIYEKTIQPSNMD